MVRFINEEKVKVVAVSALTLLYRRADDHKRTLEESAPPDNTPVLIETLWGEVLLCQRSYRHGLGDYRWTITGTTNQVPAASIRTWWHYK